jgi:hypothetical protein
LLIIFGFDVDDCEKTNLELMRIANQTIIDMANKRDAKEARKKELADKNIGTSASGGWGGPQSHSSATGPSTSAISSSTSPFFVPSSRPGGQPFYSVNN